MIIIITKTAYDKYYEYYYYRKCHQYHNYYYQYIIYHKIDKCPLVLFNDNK